MKKEKDIRDDEIRVIGEEKRSGFTGWKWLLLLLAGIIIGGIIWSVLPSKPEESTETNTEKNVEPSYFDSRPKVGVQSTITTSLGEAKEMGHGFIEISDTTINDIPMRIYVPHWVTMSLHLGPIDRNDKNILFAAQAADIRADNGGIVGAFVLQGEPKAWGLSKRGYCAIINGVATLGVAENSPLFEEATEKGGYFFRQYPLVDHGQMVENKPKGKSIRRALCERNGEIFTVETLTTESFHDFAQALVDIGADNAIYLCGSTAYGWATDAEGRRHEFGDPNLPEQKWENVSYLVMRTRP